MDNARARMLSRIRRSASKGDEAARISAVERRLENPHCNIVPDRGQGDEAHRIGVRDDQIGIVELLGRQGRKRWSVGLQRGGQHAGRIAELAQAP